MLEKSKGNLVWIDLEMTGLNFETDRIIEIAIVVTSKSLKTIEIGPNYALSCAEEELANMNEWCLTNHKKSGLYDRCLKSTIDLETATNECIEFLEKYCYPNIAPLCGNSICTDRRFLAKDMPKLDNFLHYRQIDVTSISELAKRWDRKIYNNKPKKKESHLALDDIKESIIELQYYQENWLRCNEK